MTVSTEHQDASESSDGHERRSRNISEDDIKKLAREAADMAISDMFEIFGIDVTTKEGRKGLQDDFSWVRDARVGSAGMRKAGSVAIIGALVTGATYALWKGLVAMTMLATKMGQP